MSSANSLAFGKFSAKAFMYIRNKTGPNVEPWGTHALTPTKEEACPLSTILCFLFVKKFNNKFKMLSCRRYLIKCLKLAIHLTIYGIFFIQIRTKRYYLYQLLLNYHKDIFLDRIISF